MSSYGVYRTKTYIAGDWTGDADAIQKLYEWKNMLNGRMPLLIYGARQVGKTYEMREFGALYYKNTIYVNFETDERIGKYLETDIHADYVISVLEKYDQAKVVPENMLIIFDEIQMCERALTSLKYFSAPFKSSCVKSTPAKESSASTLDASIFTQRAKASLALS